MTNAQPRMLVVAGYDPSGGAGVDADREAANSLNVATDCVVTADTDQDGVSVAAIRPRAAELWLTEAAELLRVSADLRPRVIKSGMLIGAPHVRALIQLAKVHPEIPLVVDPVLAASGGELFMDDAGLKVLRDELMPLGPILTPNLPELARLLSIPEAKLANVDARELAAQQLLELGASAVLVKGGHAAEDPICDLIVQRGAPVVRHEHARVPGSGIHGSGCRYASRLAAGLALGMRLESAADGAGHYLRTLIAKAHGSQISGT